MTKPYLHIAAILLCAVLLLPSCTRRAEPVANKVVLYCSVDQAVAEPIVAAFEKQTGLDVLARYDTEASKTVGLVQKILAEKAAPQADLFWSSEVFHTIQLAREGLLTPYENELTAAWPAPFYDEQRRWYGFGVRARVIAYHTDRITADEAPQKLEDLLDKKWSGRIVMATPNFGTTGGDVASWFAHYGPERAQEILHQLKANGVRLVDGNSTAVRMVCQGRADLCLTDTDDVFAAQRNGHPIALNYLMQADAGVLTIPNTAALITGGPNKETAAKLMAFLLSEQVEAMLAESDSGNFCVRDIAVQRRHRVAKPVPLNISYEKVADTLTTAIRTADTILR